MRIVQKYGGSSVATAEKIRDIAKFIKTQKKNNEIVVVLSAMGKTTNALIEEAKQMGPFPSKRELDLLLSIGEIKSVCLMALSLQNLGVDAVALTGTQAGIKTNKNFGKAFIEKVDTKRIEKELSQNKVVVVAGFQGSCDDEITTLGRGGSDSTAVALAAALGAKCEIYTDVENVFAISPGLVKNPKPIKKISYDEMMEMSFAGAKVLETRCVELAKKYDVSLYLGKTLGKGCGTFVLESVEDVAVKSLSMKENMYALEIEDALDALRLIEKLNINLEMFSFCKGKIFLVVSGEEVKNAKKILKKHKILCKNSEKIAKITLVGAGIATHPAFALKIFSRLADENIEIIRSQISEISIMILVKEKDKEKAVSVLSSLFGLAYD